MRRTDKILASVRPSVEGRVVAVTGATGGLGRSLCRYLASLGASLLLLDRNRERSCALASELTDRYGVRARHITVDMEDEERVAALCDELSALELDYLILNAGAYAIPRHKCKNGFDNVFQINFRSPYMMACRLAPKLTARGGRVVAVGSIAYAYSRIDPNDPDFSTRKAASKVYGNAKRHLMSSLLGMQGVTVTHPGIAVTGITAHYPKWLYAIIKYPMKVIFMSPEKAALSIVKGFFEPTEYHTWHGPRIFNVWGLPSKKTLRTCSIAESERIAAIAEDVYHSVKAKCENTL